jgi:DNA polymerase/3'-5' exonuclease PolX
MGSIVREIARRWRESLGERLGITVCGSYRRGSRTSNDVDLVVRHMGPGPTPLTAADLLAPLRRGGFVPADGDLVRHPVVRYMGFCRLPGHRWFRRLDIVWVPTNDRAQLPATVLALTGSADFNRALRNRARELGIRLGSNSLRWADDTDSSPFPYAILRTERDIFRLLGVPYLAPQDR